MRRPPRLVAASMTALIRRASAVGGALFLWPPADCRGPSRRLSPAGSGPRAVVVLVDVRHGHAATLKGL